MGHTAIFAVELSTSSGIMPKEHLERHKSVGPCNLEIHRVFAKLFRYC